MTTPTSDIDNLIRSIPGPILILGANGFVGWNFFLKLKSLRSDVHGLCRRPNWRTQSQTLTDLHFENQGATFKELLLRLKPTIIMDLAAHGAYPSQQDLDEIFTTNVLRVAKNLEELSESALRSMYLLAGSSSEYGTEVSHAKEDQLSPNSLYAVSKASSAQLITYFGKHRGVACAHLRLFSVYGPYEEPGRLITELCRQGLHQQWPALSHAKNARDFLYVEDALSAFLKVAQKLLAHPELKAEYFNVGTGRELKLREVAFIAGELFDIQGEPRFGEYPDRPWEIRSWTANSDKLKSMTGWEPHFGFEEGLELCKAWWMQNPKLTPDPFGAKKALISVVVAVHKDEKSLEEIYQGVLATSLQHKFDFELLLINDASPDRSEQKILELSRRDQRVRGLTHTRNFGSQAAFWSGMEIAQGDAVVLMDGDLQDPPNLIGEMHDLWNIRGKMAGPNLAGGTVVPPLVVGAQRSSREMSFAMVKAHRLFYRLAALCSGAKMPADVGDFSLMDRRVVNEMLVYKDQFLWLRGIRAHLGFPAAYVSYHRPKRRHGVSTNSLMDLCAWAYRGIFGFSGEPLWHWKKIALGVGVIALLMAFAGRPEKAIFLFLLVILVTLVLIADLLVLTYRQSLGRPRRVILSVLYNGEVHPWKKPN